MKLLIQKNLCILTAPVFLSILVIMIFWKKKKKLYPKMMKFESKLKKIYGEVGYC